MTGAASADKHRQSIIQSSQVKRIRRPGTKRQVRIIAYVLAIVGATAAMSYYLLRPENESYTLRNWTTAVVDVQTIQDNLQLGGTVRARTEATVRAPVGGVLESVLVDVGDWIIPGQVIAVLDAEDLKQALETQKHNLAQANRSYKSMLLSRERELLLSSRLRENIEDELESAKENIVTSRELHKLGSITAAALKDAETLVANSRNDLEDHDEDEDITARIHELEKLDSEDALAQIAGTIAYLENQLADTRIVVETEGRVVWTLDTIVAVGNKIDEDAPIVQVADTRDPFVETVIEEQYVSDISIGQEASVTISGKLLKGAIAGIGLIATTPVDGGPPVVDLDLSVEVEDFEALPGGTARVELIVGVVPDALVLPRGPFLSTGNHLYLFRINGNAAVRTRTTFGAVTEKYVEIVSGVAAGDTIVTSSYQNYIDFEFIGLSND